MTARRVSIFVVLIATLSWHEAAFCQTSQKQPAAAAAAAVQLKSPKVPSAEQLLVLLRAALVALHQANVTGNYTVLHGLGSPAFQQQNTPATLGIAFTSLRDRKLSLLPTLIITPQLSGDPVLTPDGILRMEGSFPTVPMQLSFVAMYQAPDWRLAGLSVSASPTPAATPSQAAPAAPAKPEMKDKKAPDLKKSD